MGSKGIALIPGEKDAVSKLFGLQLADKLGGDDSLLSAENTKLPSKVVGKEDEFAGGFWMKKAGLEGELGLGKLSGLSFSRNAEEPTAPVLIVKSKVENGIVR